jgi:hypothetical protein
MMRAGVHACPTVLLSLLLFVGRRVPRVGAEPVSSSAQPHYSNNKIDLGFYTKVSHVAVAAKGRDAVGGSTVVHKLPVGATASHVAIGDILTLLDVVKHGSKVTAVTVDVPSLEVTLHMNKPFIHTDASEIVEDVAIAVDRVVRQTESFVLADGNYDLGTLEVELAQESLGNRGHERQLVPGDEPGRDSACREPNVEGCGRGVERKGPASNTCGGRPPGAGRGHNNERRGRRAAAEQVFRRTKTPIRLEHV